MSLIKISTLDKDSLGQKITVSGWVENIRDHGGVIFIDLREGNEILQVVVEPQNKDIFEIAESIRNEFVITVYGEVKERPKGTVNEKMITGEIELNSESEEIRVPSWCGQEITGIKSLSNASLAKAPISELSVEDRIKIKSL